MSYPKVSFQVRLRSTDRLEDVGRRVMAALGCEFVPAYGHEFEPDEALEATTLGLVVHLIGDPQVESDTETTFVLRGLVRPDVEAQLDHDAPTISISDYVLGVMRHLDHQGWYIAERSELLAEAGLPAEDEPEH